MTPALSISPSPAAENPALTCILRQARAHFFSHGYSQCTMDELAAELGMSKKTLYVHFSSKEALVRAVTDNQQLWSTLAADVAQPGNSLPAALRARLFYLYQFTAQHSRAVLDGKASVEVLADINTAVMRGLRGEGGAA